MIANNITLSPATDNKLRIRAFFDKHSREPRGETERYWQRQLTELDAELHLRFNLETQRYIILYDHHGLVTVVWSFAPDESFGLAMMNLRHKTTLNARKLRDMLKAEREGQEAAASEELAPRLRRNPRRAHRPQGCAMIAVMEADEVPRGRDVLQAYLHRRFDGGPAAHREGDPVEVSRGQLRQPPGEVEARQVVKALVHVR